MSEAKDKKDDTKADDKKSDDKPKKTLSLGGTLSLKGGPKAAPSVGGAQAGVAVEVRRKRTAPAQDTQSTSSTSEDERLTSSEKEAPAEPEKVRLQCASQTSAMDYIMSLDGGVTFLDGYDRYVPNLWQMWRLMWTFAYGRCWTQVYHLQQSILPPALPYIPHDLLPTPTPPELWIVQPSPRFI